MVLPQSSPFMADALETTSVPPMGPHPSLPIVVDLHALHKRTHSNNRQFEVQPVGGEGSFGGEAENLISSMS